MSKKIGALKFIAFASLLLGQALSLFGLFGSARCEITVSILTYLLLLLSILSFAWLLIIYNGKRDSQA